MEIFRDINGESFIRTTIPLTDPNTGNFVPAITDLGPLTHVSYWSSVAADYVAPALDPTVAEVTSQQGYYLIQIAIVDLVNLDINRNMIVAIEDNQPTKRWKDQSFLIDVRELYNQLAAIQSDVTGLQSDIATLQSDVTQITNQLPAGGLVIASQDDILNLDQRIVGMNPNAPTYFSMASTGIQMMRIVCTFHNDGGVIVDPNNEEIAFKMYSKNDQGYFANSMFFDDVAMNFPSTVSSTYTGSVKMKKVSLGYYELYVAFDAGVHYSTLPNQLTSEFNANEDSPILELFATRNTQLQGQAETGFLVNLIDNDTNKAVIAKSLVEFDSSSLIIDSGSVEKRISDLVQIIIDKLPLTGLISNIDKTTIFDGISFDTIIQTLYGDIAGRKKKDVISSSVEQHTIYKQNNVTELLKKQITADEQIKL